MADRGEARSTSRDAVVRPLSRAAVRPCARPGCPSPARATLSFRYATREAWLEALHDESSPATYDLCGSHADRTRPPTGWGIVDERPAEDQERAEPAPARDLGDEHTVAVLAAALRAVPEPRIVAPAEPATVEETTPDEDPFTQDGPVALADLDLSPASRGGIEAALAELAAVARGDAGPEQIAIELDDEPAPATVTRDDPALDPERGPAPAPEPRPVRAARERAGDDGSADHHGGPARAW